MTRDTPNGNALTRSSQGATLTTIAFSLIICIVVVGSAFAGPVNAQSTPTPQFVVTVHADGAATIAVTSTFDLTTDAEKQAFRSLQNDAEAKAEAKSRFIARLRSIVNATEDVIGREMEITGGSIELTTTPDNDTGILTLSATWDGLAAQRDSQLVVTEPFASEFSPDRQFVLRAPDGYRIDEASPRPSSMNESQATWSAGQTLDGFEVVMVETVTTASPTASTTAAPSPTQGQEGTATPGQPGFGFFAGVLALLFSLVLVDWLNG